MSTDPNPPPRLNAVTPLPPARGRPVQVLQVMGNAIVGGMETWVLRLLQRLPRERFCCTVLSPYESPITAQFRALGVDVEVAPMPEDLPWTTLQLASALVRERGIELLHAHMPQAHLLAGLVGRLTGTPVLTTLHARQLTTLDLEVQRLAGSHVSVVARQTYFHALGLGVDRDLLSCEPNGVDTTVFRPRSRQPGEPLRQRLGLAPEVPLAGFVGRLSPEKGPEVFVRALMMLRTRCPEAQGVFIGEGPMQDELHGLARRHGLTDGLHFAGLWRDMPGVYGELDAVVSSSHTEAMPLAVMEAMASGLPVVATRVGGVPDLVEHGHTGWLVNGGDFDEIGRCTALLLNDASLRQRMGARARERAVARLDLAAGIARIGALIERLARPASTTRAHATPR